MPLFFIRVLRKSSFMFCESWTFGTFCTSLRSVKAFKFPWILKPREHFWQRLRITGYTVGLNDVKEGHTGNVADSGGLQGRHFVSCNVSKGGSESEGMVSAGCCCFRSSGLCENKDDLLEVSAVAVCFICFDTEQKGWLAKMLSPFSTKTNLVLALPSVVLSRCLTSS